MLNNLTKLWRKENGSIAAMGGIMAGLLALTTTFVIDYSQAVNNKSTLQRAADAATLVAASNYRDTGDKKLALERAQEFFDNKADMITGVEATYTFDVGETDDDGTILATATINATFKSLFNGGVLGDRITAVLDTEAIIRQTPQDLYLVLLVDSTASMNQLIASVRDSARQLEDDVRDKLEAKGLEFNKLYVKVAFFGDLRVDQAPYGWRESPLYDLSKPSETNAFRRFVASTPTFNGYDLPESSVSAIAHFLTAPIPEPLIPAQTVQSIVVWTDAAGLPLDDARIVDDVTVNLYKKYGSVGSPPYFASTYWYSFIDGFWHNSRFPRYYYNEDAEFDGDAYGTEASPPSYGCCSTFEVFEERWLSGGAVPLKRRSLGLIVPTVFQPWVTMVDWPNVTIRNYATPSANGIVDDIVDSLGDEYSPLVVSR